MFTKTHEGIFARHNENSGTDLPFATLLMPDIFAKQTEREEPPIMTANRDIARYAIL